MEAHNGTLADLLRTCLCGQAAQRIHGFLADKASGAITRPEIPSNNLQRWAQATAAAGAKRGALLVQRSAHTSGIHSPCSAPDCQRFGAGLLKQQRRVQKQSAHQRCSMISAMVMRSIGFGLSILWISSRTPSDACSA